MKVSKSTEVIVRSNLLRSNDYIIVQEDKQTLKISQNIIMQRTI